MDAVFAVADRITVMVNGQVLESGSPEQIRASPAVRQAYLGDAVDAYEIQGCGMSEALLEARELHAYYGASHILHGVDFRIERGETVGLMGRNGMGKSTLIRSMLGLVKPRDGEVLRLRHADDRRRAVSRRAAGHRVRAGGARHLSESHRAREPRDGGARRARRPPRLDATSACWRRFRASPSGSTTAAGSSPAASSRC